MDAVPAAEERSPSHIFNSSDYSCEICLTNYNESSRLPKILQCGHTFCLECTFQLGPGDDISCPLCRIITYLGWDDELPTNFSFLNILQKMNLLCTEPPPSDINTADYSQDFEEDPLDPDSYVPNAENTEDNVPCPPDYKRCPKRPEGIATMSLTADPAACSVPATGGNTPHQLTNVGTDRLAFKVKSSNNNEYRIKPVFGFVEPGAATPLEITRTTGGAKEDKLVVHFAVVPADAADAKMAFEGAQPAGSITIPLSAA